MKEQRRVSFVSLLVSLLFRPYSAFRPVLPTVPSVRPVVLPSRSPGPDAVLVAGGRVRWEFWGHHTELTALGLTVRTAIFVDLLALAAVSFAACLCLRWTLAAIGKWSTTAATTSSPCGMTLATPPDASTTEKSGRLVRLRCPQQPMHAGAAAASLISTT